MDDSLLLPASKRPRMTPSEAALPDAEPSEAALPSEPPSLQAPEAALPSEPPNLQAPEDNMKMVLNRYREREQYWKGRKQKKPDMKAYAEVSREHPTEDVYGAAAGIPVGMRFRGKGELAVVGVHKSMMSGIHFDSKRPEGAFAIVMSGGYKDDDDTGSGFDYTGMGGQRDGFQIKDQTLTRGNLALKHNHDTGTPVRVVRGVIDPATQQRCYIYDGLHTVTKWYHEPSVDGPLVYKFTMVAVPGFSQPPVRRVRFSCFSRPFSNVTLGDGLLRRDGQRRQLRDAAEVTKRREARRAALEAKPVGLVVPDVSGGREQMPVPVFNTVDEQPAPQFEYICSTATAQCLTEAAVSAKRNHSSKVWHPDTAAACARRPCYSPHGLLVDSYVEGIVESCAECVTPEAAQNRVVSHGVHLALEVFRCPDGKGWGARCSEDVWAGDFVAEYAGDIITDHEAELRDDTYLFNLDHFAQPGADDEPAKTLCIDAKSTANVARFFNHSVDANLIAQPVFSKLAGSSMHYHVAFFANRDIPVGEELCFDYFYGVSADKGYSVPDWFRQSK